MENTCNALGVSDRIVEERVAAMWADVVEGPHFHVFATDHEELRPARMMESAVIERVRQLRFVAADDPAFIENLFLLFTEDLVIRINPGIYKMSRRKFGLLFPCDFITRHSGLLSSVARYKHFLSMVKHRSCQRLKNGFRLRAQCVKSRLS